MIININLNPYSHVINDCIGYIKHTDPDTAEAERKNFFLLRSLMNVLFEATFYSCGINEYTVSNIDSRVGDIVSNICESKSSQVHSGLCTHISESLCKLMHRLNGPLNAFLSHSAHMDNIEDFNIHGGYVIIKLGRTERELAH